MSIHVDEPVPAAADVPRERFYCLTVDQYHQMGETGILGPDDRVELLEGLIYLKHPPEPTQAEAIFRLNLDQYHRMEQDGILSANDRVELLGGWLLARPPMNPPHRRATLKVRVALERVLPAGWYVDQQAPVSLPRTNSEPEPDVQVTRGETDDYHDRHPGPNDVAILVEVADTTLAIDRGFQKQLYATEGIAIYWIVNLRDRKVEVFQDPTGPADVPDYGRCQVYGPDDALPVVLDGREIARIAVRELLP